MTDDPYASDEFRAWAKDVRAHLLPKLSESALSLTLVPTGETDLKFAIELGLSIMLDKPIIAVVQPGTKVPERLVRVADEIVEARLGGTAEESDQARLKVQAAIEAAMARIEEKATGTDG